MYTHLYNVGKDTNMLTYIVLIFFHRDITTELYFPDDFNFWTPQQVPKYVLATSDVIK